jgi:2-polyprenyl-6-methoxyphenol hydroxylase-like FAD-dependent oxidoreductase
VIADSAPSLKGPARIAVVGAGIAGLSSALYLFRLGHAVTVFERFREAQPVGSGLMLQPTGMSVLHDLGLLHAVLPLGQPILGLVGHDARSGRKILDVTYRGTRFGLGVNRATLFQVLYDAVRVAGIPIETAHEIGRADMSGGGVLLIDREGRRIDAVFDLVVDAAGVRSPLRNRDDPSAAARAFAYGAFWATLRLPNTGFAFDRLAQRYERASVMIGVMPAGRIAQYAPHTCAFFWSVKSADVASVRSAGLAAWKARVLDLWPATAPLLDQIESFSDLAFAEYWHLTLRRPYWGRVIHVGDSAHATSPQLGQGAYMALLDARALAHAIAGGGSLDAVCAAYARSRRLHVRFFQLASRALTPFYQSDSRLIPWLRDGLVATVAKVPPMPSLLAGLVSGTIVSPFGPIGMSEVDWTSVGSTRAEHVAIADVHDC